MASKWNLKSLAIECIVKNLSFYQNSEFEGLKQLPRCLKNEILQRFTVAGIDQGINEFLVAIINEDTNQLDLNPFNVTDNLLGKLCVSENLERITWFEDRFGCGCQLTSAGLINFLQHTNGLTFLTLIKSDKVNDHVLECISKNCPNLKILLIAGSQNVTDTGLKHLSNTNLIVLYINETNISDRGLMTLSTGKINNTLKELVVGLGENILPTLIFPNDFKTVQRFILVVPAAAQDELYYNLLKRFFV